MPQLKIISEHESEKHPQAGFYLSSTEERYLLTNSIERGLNTVLEVLQNSKHPDAYQCMVDLLESRQLIVNLWLAAQHAIQWRDLG